MKGKAVAAMMMAVVLWTLQPAVLAESGEAGASSFSLAEAGRFFGGFILVMALIYGAVLLTAWIGKKWGKH